MKIVILSDDFPPVSFGGAGIIAESQACELARRGHHVIVVTSAGEEREKTIQRDGFHILTVSNPISVEKILQQERPDVVHIHNVHQALSYKMFPLARKYAKKVFFTAHDAMSVHYSKIYPKMSIDHDGKRHFDYRISFWHQLRYFWRQWKPFRTARIQDALKNVDKILAVSHSLKEALEQNGLKNIEVLHNGIDVERFSVSEQSVEEFKRAYRLENKQVVFFAGRIGKAKGGDVILELLVALNKTHPNLCFVVAGRDDRYLAQLKQKASAHGIGDRIISLGWIDREQVRCAYAAADIIPSLSLYADPFPTVNLEAMAAARPVLGTCFGGTPEIVVDEVTGYIVDPRNISEVVARAKTLLDNPAFAQNLGKAGRSRVIKGFSLQGWVDQMEMFYEGNK